MARPKNRPFQVKQKQIRPAMWPYIVLFVAIFIGVFFLFLELQHFLVSQFVQNKPAVDPLSGKQQESDSLSLKGMLLASEENPEISIAEHMKNHQKVIWRDYWVTPEQQKELTKLWQDKLASRYILPIKKPWIEEMRYLEGTPSGLFLRGGLDLPKLPEGLFLKIDVEIFTKKNGQEPIAYAQIPLDSQHIFHSTLSLELFPSIYFIKFSLTADEQDEILKDILQLQENHSWSLYPIMLGSDRYIRESFQVYCKNIERIVAELEKSQKAIWDLRSKKPQVVRAEWNKWFPKWNEKVRYLNDEVLGKRRSRQQLLPHIENELAKLIFPLISVGNYWDNWQRDIFAEHPEISPMHQKFTQQVNILRMRLQVAKETFQERLKNLQALRVIIDRK